VRHEIPKLFNPWLAPWLAMTLVACGAGKVGSDDTHGGDSAPQSCSFSFAILTDTHIGEGEADYAGSGWDDAGSSGNDTSDRALALAAAVAATNEAAESDDLRFAVVLGDLSDSGERSELEEASAILGDLEIPWIPLLGNHDTWPYAWEEDGKTWHDAPSPSGDAEMQAIYASAFGSFESAFPGTVHAGADCVARDGSCFVNVAFQVCGVRFLGLDTNPRVHTPTAAPGVGPEADFNDVPGGTWPFFQSDLVGGPGDGDGPVVVLSHHPFLAVGEYSFPKAQIATMTDFIGANGLENRIRAFFAGHIHIEAEVKGPLGIPVVVLPATKDTATPRIVSVTTEGMLDWGD
jgi:3',5'-cyclic AMP phosphodiesterase CpdA